MEGREYFAVSGQGPPNTELVLERAGEPRRRHFVRQAIAGYDRGTPDEVLRLESAAGVLVRWRVAGFGTETFEPFVAGPTGGLVRLVVPDGGGGRRAFGTLVGWTDVA